MSKSEFDVLIAGSPYWASILEDELKDMDVSTIVHQGLRNSLRQLKYDSVKRFCKSKILHWISAPTEGVHLFMLAHLLKIKVVVQWIGSDVVGLSKYVRGHGSTPRLLFQWVDVHLAVSEHLKHELADLGIFAQVVSLLPKTIQAEVLPLPKKPAALSYWQDERAIFYGAEMVIELARNFPQVDFYIVRATGKGLANVPENMIFLGEVSDMDSVYQKVSVLLRLPCHDGLSGMLLESLARGRYVLYSHSFPHTTRLIRLEDGFAALKQALSATSPNLEGAAYVRENFSWQQEVQKLKYIYSELLI